MKTPNETEVFGMVLENSVNPQIISLSGPDGVVYTKSLESFRDEGIIPSNKIDFPFSTKFNEDKSLLEGFPIQRICEYQLLPSDKELIQNCFSFAAFYYNGIIPNQHIDSNLFSCLESKQRTDSFNKGDILYLSNSKESNDYHFVVTLEEGKIQDA